jgi:hypothetical protein
MRNVPSLKIFLLFRSKNRTSKKLVSENCCIIQAQKKFFKHDNSDL